MAAFYNEIDPYAAAWLRNLIDAGHIAPGVVDERDIRDIRPEELHPYNQCHFFAGIGVWSHALRSAGWPDDRPVWTGSCPCQPFSAAGAGGGFADERHLWPHFHWLIAQCRPPVVFGEQVASKDGLGWLDLVQADMEGSGYAFGANDLCAAGIGAPHIRQRLWFVGVADAEREQRQRGRASETRDEPGSVERVERFCDDGGLADTAGPRSLPGAHAGIHRGKEGAGARHGEPERPSDDGGMADAHDAGPQGRGRMPERIDQRAAGARGLVDGDGRASPTDGFWRDADWLFCRDGKWRPVEPGTFPLAHGVANRVGRLRAYGNAVVAPLAQTFVETVMECL